MAEIVLTPENVQNQNSPTVEIAKAGEGIYAGDAIFRDAEGELYLLSASSGYTGPQITAGDLIGIALNTATMGQVCTFVRRPGDRVNYGPGVLTQGLWYVVSPTPGALMPASDLSSSDYSIMMGYAESDSVLVLLPKWTGVAVQ